MQQDSDLKIPIGRFSQLTTLSSRALRIYDEKGLLTPKRDRFNNYRYYTADQIETGLRIKTLGWMGFSCAEMDALLDCLEAPAANRDMIETIFKRRLAETQIEIQRLKKVEEVLQGKNALEVLYMTSTEPVIKQIPGMRVVSRREMGPPQAVIQKLMGEVIGQIFSPANQRGGVNISGPPMLMFDCLSINPDPKEGELVHTEWEVAFPIVGRVMVDEGFDLKTLSPVKVVSVMHTGRYSDVGGAYAKAFDHICRNGLQIKGLCREIYLSDPREVPESELLTEIQMPVS